MIKKKAVAYWNILDSKTGAMLEKEKAIDHIAMPSIGGLMIGTPDRPNVIVQRMKFSGIKDHLPLYNVYV